MSMNYDAQEHEVMDYYAQAHMEQVFEHFVDDVNAKVEARFGLSIADFPDFDFYNYAPERWQCPIDRFTMEVKRQLDVLDRRLADNRYMCGEEYTIADIAIWPWYGALVLSRLYNAGEFLDVESYKHVMRWALEIDARETVQRGRMVNRAHGELHEQPHGDSMKVMIHNY